MQNGSRQARGASRRERATATLQSEGQVVSSGFKRRLLEGLGETVGVLMISRHEDGFNHAVIVQMPNIMK